MNQVDDNTNDDNFNEFLDAFLYNHGVFPDEPLRGTIERIEQYKPLLFLILKGAKDAYDDDSRELVGHYYALYILAQVREKHCFPLVCELLALPDNDPLIIFSEVAFEHMPAILASVYDGNSGLMYQLITDPEACIFSKIACISAFELLYRAKKIDRKELVRIFCALFDELQSPDDAGAMIRLLETVRNLQLQEVIDFIYSLLQDEFVSPDILTLSEFEGCLRCPIDEPKEPFLVDDAIEMLRQLECFSYLDVQEGFTEEEREYWGHDIGALVYNLASPPIDVLERLIARPNEAKILLHRIIDYTLVKYSSIEVEKTLVLYAIYLLAQFRDTIAYEKIINLIELVDIEDDECPLTEAFMRDGHRLLASLYNGDLESLFDMMENPYGAFLARHTALRVLCLLCHLQKIDRTEFVQKVLSQIEILEAEENSSLLALLVLEMLYLRLYEVFDRIGICFKKDAVDLEIVSLEQFEDAVAQGQPMYEDCHLINDIFEEVQSWPVYEEVEQRVVLASIGRNDPCSCGSGKKFKKCCM